MDSITNEDIDLMLLKINAQKSILKILKKFDDPEERAQVIRSIAILHGVEL